MRAVAGSNGNEQLCNIHLIYSPTFLPPKVCHDFAMVKFYHICNTNVRFSDTIATPTGRLPSSDFSSFPGSVSQIVQTHQHWQTLYTGLEHC